RCEAVGRGAIRQIGAAHAVAEVREHLRDAAHARAADADEVNVFDDVFHCFPSRRARATAAQTCATRSVASGFASALARSAMSASVVRVWRRSQSASFSGDKSRCCTTTAPPSWAKNSALVV